MINRKKSKLDSGLSLSCLLCVDDDDDDDDDNNDDDLHWLDQVDVQYKLDVFPCTAVCITPFLITSQTV